jgi:hypothetical protein
VRARRYRWSSTPGRGADLRVKDLDLERLELVVWGVVGPAMFESEEFVENGERDDNPFPFSLGRVGRKGSGETGSVRAIRVPVVASPVPKLRDGPVLKRPCLAV